MPEKISNFLRILFQIKPQTTAKTYVIAVLVFLLCISISISEINLDGTDALSGYTAACQLYSSLRLRLVFRRGVQQHHMARRNGFTFHSWNSSIELLYGHNSYDSTWYPTQISMTQCTSASASSFFAIRIFHPNAKVDHTRTNSHHSVINLETSCILESYYRPFK